MKLLVNKPMQDAIKAAMRIDDNVTRNSKLAELLGAEVLSKVLARARAGLQTDITLVPIEGRSTFKVVDDD